MKTKPSTDKLPQLISAKAASREIGIPYQSLRDAAFRGLIPVVKIGRAWYFDRKDLIAFIEKAKENLK